MKVSILIAAVALFAACRSARCADFVPFVIPTTQNEKSLIAFPSRPIEPNAARLVARDGHFFLGGGPGADRVRICGVNLCFAANFPTHADAERVAAPLAAFGINSVRFHHMDSQSFPRRHLGCQGRQPPLGRGAGPAGLPHRTVRSGNPACLAVPRPRDGWRLRVRMPRGKDCESMWWNRTELMPNAARGRDPLGVRRAWGSWRRSRGSRPRFARDWPPARRPRKKSARATGRRSIGLDMRLFSFCVARDDEGDEIGTAHERQAADRRHGRDEDRDLPFMGTPIVH